MEEKNTKGKGDVNGERKGQAFITVFSIPSSL
jgi:hypothetical protein